MKKTIIFVMHGIFLVYTFLLMDNFYHHLMQDFINFRMKSTDWNNSCKFLQYYQKCNRKMHVAISHFVCYFGI